MSVTQIIIMYLVYAYAQAIIVARFDTPYRDGTVGYVALMTILAPLITIVLLIGAFYQITHLLATGKFARDT